MRGVAGAPAAAAPIPLLPILAAATLLAAVAARLHLVLLSGGIPLPLFCPFLRITGVPCPTCGSTRALAALTRGDLAAALAFNPLVATASVLLVGAGIASLAIRALRLEISVPRPGPGLDRLFRAAAVLAILANWAYLIRVW